MEWLKEILKNAGIEEGNIDGIVSNINKEVPKHFIPKDKYNELTNTKNQLEKDIQERDKQLKELGETAGLSEDLKKQIEQLQADNKAAKEQYEKDLKELTITNAIKTVLVGKVHDEDLVAGLFDREKLVLDGDKIVGLDEQLKTLKESKAFLFKQEEQQQSGFRVGGDGQGNAVLNNPFSKEHWNLTEQGKLFKQNPELYKALMAQVRN
ncbi:phage scaffolding protein [Bacillus kwashiorkori]|uniref:phage scaffolding protein n=1 Tax=Bacillus kwashiorkori TaxID=1522318 RepID=UPI0008F8DE30|nr:phage scaffolding protein [Bacillus kwashiorkori]